MPYYTNQKKVAVLISDKADFRAKKCIKDKEKAYIMTMGPILKENVTIFTMNVPNNRVWK